MSFTDDEIDKIAQDAASKVEVPYQDSYWAEMEALLPSTSKRKPFWWLFSVIFALVGLATTLFLFSPKESSYDKQLQANLKETHDTAADLQAKAEISSNQEVNAIGIAPGKSANDSRSTEELKDANALSEKNTNLSNAEQLAAKSVANVEGSSSLSTNKASSNTSNASRASKQSNPHTSKDAREQKESKHNGNQLVAESDKKEVSKDLLLAKSQEVNDEFRGGNSNTTSSKQGASQTETRINGNQKDENLIKNELAKNSAVLESDVEKEVATHEKSNETLEIKAVVASEKGDSLRKQEQTLVEPEGNSAMKETPVSSKTLSRDVQQPVTSGSYYVQAGMRFSQSYLKTASGKMMTGVMIGAGYQLIRPGFGYSVGIHATSHFVQNMEIIRKARVYGFGVTNYQQNLKYKQLTYLEMPIVLNYIDLKNTYSVGLAPTYLVSTMMSFTERQDIQILNERNYYGQKVGLNSVGLDLMVGYQRNIKNNWSIGVNVGISLLQQIDGDQFYDKSVAMPLHGQITLRKTLIPKK